VNTTYYCVVHIASNRVRYIGRSEDDMAEALEPGTSWGKGINAIEAEKAALLAAWKVRKSTVRFN